MFAVSRWTHIERLPVCSFFVAPPFHQIAFFIFFCCLVWIRSVLYSCFRLGTAQCFPCVPDFFFFFAPLLGQCLVFRGIDGLPALVSALRASRFFVHLESLTGVPSPPPAWTVLTQSFCVSVLWIRAPLVRCVVSPVNSRFVRTAAVVDESTTSQLYFPFFRFTPWEAGLALDAGPLRFAPLFEPSTMALSVFWPNPASCA